MSLESLWALCVRVNEKKLRKLKASQLYLLDLTKMEMYPFRYLTYLNRKQKYGLIVNEEVHVYNIFTVTGKSIVCGG